MTRLADKGLYGTTPEQSPAAGGAEQGRPARHPATCHRLHGVRCFQGSYSIGDDTLRGANRRKKGAANALTPTYAS